MANRQVPSLSDSPWAKLADSLPAILLRLKENQQNQQNIEQQRQDTQKQATQQLIQDREAATLKQKNLVDQRNIDAKNDKLGIYTDLISGEEDSTTKSKFIELLSDVDPENAGTYQSIANTYKEKGVQEEQQWNLFRNYTTGKTSPEEFYGQIDFKSPAYEQAVKFEKANGKDVSSYGGWVTVLDIVTGEQKDYKIGGEGNISFYEENYNTLYEFKNSSAYNWASAEEKARVDGALKHYGGILKDKGGLDLYTPKQQDK